MILYRYLVYLDLRKLFRSLANVFDSTYISEGGFHV